MQKPKAIDAELKARLTPEQYQVTQCSATERPFSGKVGSSRVDLQACKLEYSIVSPK